MLIYIKGSNFGMKPQFNDFCCNFDILIWATFCLLVLWTFVINFWLSSYQRKRTDIFTRSEHIRICKSADFQSCWVGNIHVDELYLEKKCKM